jgi:hypothetical protein
MNRSRDLITSRRTRLPCAIPSARPARALRGKYAGLIPTTDEYLREKHTDMLT